MPVSIPRLALLAAAVAAVSLTACEINNPPTQQPVVVQPQPQTPMVLVQPQSQPTVVVQPAPPSY